MDHNDKYILINNVMSVKLLPFLVKLFKFTDIAG